MYIPQILSLWQHPNLQEGGGNQIINVEIFYLFYISLHLSFFLSLFPGKDDEKQLPQLQIYHQVNVGIPKKYC